MSVKNDKLQFKLGKTVFGIQINDRFQQDEVNSVLSYLAEPEITDNKAVNTLRNNEAVAKELAWYVANAGIKHMVVFCTSVEHAYAMKSLLCSLDVSTICVEGKMDKKAREEAIAEFTSGKAVCATNVNVLSIGFDYPEIDCIAMLRPTLSTALYVQQAGRGLRIAEGKESCLLLDFAGNVKRHGPVGNLSSIPSAKKGKGGSGVPPMKVCPECLEIVQASSRVSGRAYFLNFNMGRLSPLRE